MAEPLNVLIVEDSEDDTILLARELLKAGFKVDYERVESAEAFLLQLKERRWDLILSDYSMPGFTGVKALELLKNSGMDIPFILISGAVGEIVAVDVMKAGASDYVLKGKMDRLAPAIRRELKEAESRREKRKAEKALKESEERYRGLFENANDIVVTANLQERITSINNAVERILGYKPEEIIGRNYFAFIAPESQTTIRQMIKRKMDGGEERTVYEIQMIAKDGRLVDIEVSSWLITKDGRPFGVEAILRDITERREAEKALRESERSLAEAQRIAHLGNWDWDLTTGDVRCSEELCNIFGVSADEAWSYEKFISLIHPDDRENVEESNRRAFAEEGPFSSEYRIIRPDGAVRFIHSQGFIYHCNNKPSRMVGVIVDITERKKSEEEVARLAAAVESAAESVIVTDIGGVIQYVNPAFERVSEYTREEVYGGKLKDFIIGGEDGNSLYQEILNSMNNGVVWEGRIKSRRKNRELYEEDMTVSPIMGTKSEAIGHVVIKRDVSREVMLEQQFLQAQKMEALGTLAGGIAHDFNNILFSMIGYATLALKTISEEDENHRNLEEVVKAGARAKELVRQILTFSRRKTDQELQPVQLHLIVKEAIKLLKVSIPSNIEVREDIDNKSDTVLADPTQMHQMIMNLCANAIHAMEGDGGVLEINLRVVGIDGSEASTNPSLDAGSYVLLSVSDTGCGISAEIMDRIFDPFFTTKEVGVGTGLGLAAVHGIVASHNGGVVVNSEEGRGTAFHIYLPRAGCAPEHDENVSQLVEGGSERVLVVEDDDATALLVTKILQGAGYKVTMFTDSVKALSGFIEAPDGFDVVLMDIAMPMMTGEALIQAILKVRLDMPVIMITGYSKTITQEKALSLGARKLVFKPVVPDELLRIVREVLNSRENVN